MNNQHLISKTVLILDNEAPISWALKSILGMENYKVYTATTLEEADKITRDATLSALITEYRLNHHDTLEMIKNLKKTSPDLYVMMLTNNDVDEPQYEEIIRAGVDDYFLKPVSFSRVLLHLEKGVKRRECLKM